MSVESWERAWRVASTRKEVVWLVHKARERGELSMAMRALLRVSFERCARIPAEDPGDAVDGLTAPSGTVVDTEGGRDDEMP